MSGEPGARKMLMPLIGGTPRPFLGEHDVTPAWSPDGTRLVYFNNAPNGGDPLFVADRTGADAHQILAAEEGVRHNHNPVWSPDNQWIYFIRGLEPADEMEVWRIRPAGGSPEQLTGQVELRAVRPDGVPVELARTGVRPGGYRFTLDGGSLAYLPGLQATDFWLLDLATGKRRQLARLRNQGLRQTFDLTPDGKEIVFDRLHENSNIVLIDLPK
jgi:Tol biopolymer transport system component